ncbi:hypothetical protein Sjap_024716 [Stephania japonica]|uniref:FAD-binding PCMH-type domain-containing protein n=1 Tax=Stephania japonica TaxID=461633 RepID=A0AAP0EMJ5_9MAGN
MKSWGLLVYVLALSCSIIIVSSSTFLATPFEDDFLQCLHFNSQNFEIEVYRPNDRSYKSILQFSMYNRRFISPTTRKPEFIVVPSHESQVQAVVICSRIHGLQVRVRSGGHDFEGLSYTSHVAFVLIDLVNLRAIDVDVQDNSTWVQAGATLGEVYYRIAEKSRLHGFPAGFCPTVGVGGHFSGGGYGGMMRKHGVAADHIIDARIVNVKGEILDRETMGEDLFWAIRGGGAASFGVILAFKIKLVLVPPIVTVSLVDRALEQHVIQVIHKWQYVASSEVPKELFIQVYAYTVTNNDEDNNNTSTRRGFGRTLQTQFQIMHLGPREELIHLMEEKFPELEIKREDCSEMSWIESAVVFGGFPNTTPLDVLLDRTMQEKFAFKAKSDFVTTSISEVELKLIFEKLLEEENIKVALSPWGGKMNEIPDDEIAFPHRSGNMYLVEYMISWNEKEESTKPSQGLINWIREFHDYISPYVSMNPRAAYLNIRDLDLGHNKANETPTYSEARIWGEKYFKGNFEKLVNVKSEVDPHNFFTNEQSIPPMTIKCKVQ